MELRHCLSARYIITTYLPSSHSSTCNRALFRQLANHQHYPRHYRHHRSSQNQFPSRPARRRLMQSQLQPQSQLPKQPLHPPCPRTQINTHIQTQIWTQTYPRARPNRHRRPYSSSSSSSSSPTPISPPQQSLSTRLRSLSREYGWSALGVYIFLSVIDFPFCYLAVHMLGTERIGYWERVVVDAFAGVVGLVGTRAGKDRRDDVDGGDAAVAAPPAPAPASSVEAEADPVVDPHANGTTTTPTTTTGNLEKATIYTQLALAYALHKSLIFFRVPLTAAVTPKVVRSLRAWGWDIGKKKDRMATKIKSRIKTKT